MISPLLLLNVCLLASPAAPGPQTLDGDAKEIRDYRLTAATLTKVININRALIQEMMQDPNVQQSLKLKAQIEALEKKDQLTEAEEKTLDELREREEQLADADDNPLGGDTKTLSEMEDRIRRYAPLMLALKREAMTPRDYGKFWLAFIQASFVQGFKKSGMLKDLPPDVNPENVKFIEDHAAEIEAMQKEFEALSKRR
jgi:hypothetical protein